MVGADDFQELHDIGGREEMQSDHRFWSPGHRGDFVRGSAPQRLLVARTRTVYRCRRCFFENVMIDIHELEHRSITRSTSAKAFSVSDR